MAVDAVVFDFFGTLTPGRPKQAQTAARYEQAAALGVDPAEYDRILTETYRDRFRGIAGGVEESLAWVAARMGVKPSPAALTNATTVRVRTEYLTCCTWLGVEPSRCVYVGDGGSDELAGAAKVGMHPVHLDVPAERGDVAYGRHAAWDGAVVESLTELVPLLHSLASPAESGSAEMRAPR